MIAYVRVSSIVFSLVAFVQILRTANGWPLEIAGRSIPIWASLVAAAFAFALSAWGFAASRRGTR